MRNLAKQAGISDAELNSMIAEAEQKQANNTNAQAPNTQLQSAITNTSSTPNMMQGMQNNIMQGMMQNLLGGLFKQ